jgi:YesN/AraC family two-component response regulator
MAYQKAREIIPDIIISDIMMPEMDGLEFLKKTREDFLTSHIPFVLLTARTAKEHKLEGLETGADAYLEKPFDAEYLTVLVKNLLKQRKKLRQKFSGKYEPASDEEGLNGVEKEFLEKVNGIVMEHISNPEFSVENLMAEVGMSRSQLYRKFKAISNRNPSEYIRLLRLGHAADLLRESKYSINEVAFMSGFGNVSYFNTCFKKHFGTSPGKYAS